MGLIHLGQLAPGLVVVLLSYVEAALEAREQRPLLPLHLDLLKDLLAVLAIAAAEAGQRQDTVLPVAEALPLTPHAPWVALLAKPLVNFLEGLRRSLPW